MDDASSKSLREQYDDAKDENSKLKNDLDESQNRYMDEAENRLGVQAVLCKILNMINASDNQALIDKAYDISEKCEADAKTLMAQLEMEWVTLNKTEREHTKADSELEDKLSELEKQYEGKEIPRPEHWGGYMVKPVEMEFWQGRPNRLHDRIRYQLQADYNWLIHRLSP